MKKLITIFFVLFALTAFSQNFQYKIQLNNPVTKDVKYIQDRMYQMFDVMPTFVDSTNTFYVKTNVSISQENFEKKILEYGYFVISFSKITIDIERKENEKVD